jgi:hypothetical protein
MYDFDIQQYSKNDLEKLFQLPQDKSYTRSTLLEKKQEFFEKIANATSAKQQNPGLIKDLTIFLDEAYRLLSYFIKEPEQSYPNPRPQPIPNPHQDQKHTPQFNYAQYQDPSQERTALGQSNKYTPGTYDRTTSELIIPPEKPFKTVMQNDFNPGQINPIHTPVLTKCLNIDTRFREDLYKTKSTDFIFTLPDKIRKVVSLRLSAYEFPTSAIYNISKSYGNNYINVLCTYTPPPSPPDPNNKQTRTAVRTIIIKDGTYTPDQLITNLNEQLQPRDPVTDHLIYPYFDDEGVFNYIQFLPDQTNPPETNKIQIQTVQPQDAQPFKSQILAIGFDFTLNENKEKDIHTDIKTKMGWTLGFIRPKYYDQTSYLADSPMNLNTVKYVYMMVNDFNNSVNNNFFIGAFPKYVLNKNILARIPIQPLTLSQSLTPTQLTTTLQQENQLTQHMEPRRYFGPVDIQRLHVQVYDEFGRILDINQANFSICLTMQCLYD